MGEDLESLRRRLAWLEDEREQALINDETLREEMQRLAEERDRLLAQRQSQAVELARAQAHAAMLEARIAAMRHGSAGTGRRPPADVDYSVMAEELQTTIEELQVTAEELEVANEQLQRQKELLEQRVAERTASLTEANEALARSQELLRLAQRSAAAGTWDWEVETGTATCSPEYYDLFGLDPAAWTPSPDAWIRSIHPGDRDRARQALESAVSTPGQEDFLAEFRILHPVRGQRWIMGRGRVSRGRDGRATRVTGLSIDITRQKEMEHALREAVIMAERANQAKTRFIAAASHDLRQPIQAASLYTGLIGYQAKDEATRELLGLLQASIDGLHSMLDGLLDLSRLEAGVIEPKIAAFNPDDLMIRLASEFQAQAEHEGIELRVRPCGLAVRSDAHLLERILRNLMANAVTHTEEGRVLFACRRHGGHAEFQVWDTGPGISEEHRKAIFEEFHQLHNPERNAARGFGLGLAIVHRLARLLGLEVGLRSVVGRGSVFWVRVPLATPAEAAAMELRAGPAPTADLTRLRGRTVLVVEDDLSVRKGVVMLLELWGMNVVSSSSRDEMAELLDHIEERPSALISDYRLPGGHTGRAVVEMVRVRWDLPAIIMTGDTGPDRLREAAALDCRLLHKPVEANDLARTLDELIAS